MKDYLKYCTGENGLVGLGLVRVSEGSQLNPTRRKTGLGT